MRRFLRYQFPPLLLAAIILFAANDHFSSDETGGVLSRLFSAVFDTLPPGADDIANFVMRKAAHLIEYGLLSYLAFRGLRAEVSGWRKSWAIGAVLYVIAVASADEWLQSFTLLRTGTPADVVIDTLGALATQFVIRRRALHWHHEAPPDRSPRSRHASASDTPR
jgi:VanZ family protein